MKARIRTDEVQISRDERGLTIIEATIILVVLSLLSAILAPSIGQFIRRARLARAQEDCRAIATAIRRYIDDTGENAFFSNGQGGINTPLRTSSSLVGLLTGDGDMPDAAFGVSVDNWRKTASDTLIETTNNGVSITAAVDTISNQLIENRPNGTTPGYRTTAQMSDGSASSNVTPGLRFDPQSGQRTNSTFAWRGPYINPVGPDPWGNRYAVNVIFLYRPQSTGNDGFAADTFVISAGPDEELDTPFKIDGAAPADDDIVFIVAGNSP